MEKVIRDGMVAVAISPGFGAGWYSWHNKKELLFHPTIIEFVETDRLDDITEELCQKILNTDEYICTMGSENLVIKWIPIGTKFRIDEYDGAESLELLDDILFLTA